MDIGDRVMHDCMDAGGTIPWKESVEVSQERRPRTTQEIKSRSNYRGYGSFHLQINAIDFESSEAT